MRIQAWLFRLLTRHKTRLSPFAGSQDMSIHFRQWKTDSEARRIAASNNITANTVVPYKDYCPIIKARVRQEWATSWTAVNDNNFCVIKDHTKPWHSPSQRNRQHEILLCRLSIRRTRLTHRYLMERGYLTNCEDCLVSLSVKHIRRNVRLGQMCYIGISRELYYLKKMIPYRRWLLNFP